MERSVDVRPVDEFDISDYIINDVEDGHSLTWIEGDASVIWSEGTVGPRARVETAACGV